MAKPNRRAVYRSIRHGNRVVRTYVGPLSDSLTRIVNRQWQLQDAAADAEIASTSSELEVVSRQSECLKLVSQQCSRLLRNLRKRFRREGDLNMLGHDTKDQELTQCDYEAIVQGATEGDPGDLKKLREILKANPAIFQTLGDVSTHVENSLIELISGGIADIQESLHLSIERQRMELLKSGDSPEERLLVDQVLATFLDVANCQIAYAQKHARTSIKERWQRHLAQAQKRHHFAIQSLVEVRSMLAEKQGSQDEDGPVTLKVHRNPID